MRRVVESDIGRTLTLLLYGNEEAEMSVHGRIIAIRGVWVTVEENGYLSDIHRDIWLVEKGK